MATKPDPTPEPDPPTVTTLDLLHERLRRLCVQQDEARRLHTQAAANLRAATRLVDETRTAIELTQNPGRGFG